MTRLRINGETINVDADPQMPLLWAIRDVLGIRMRAVLDIAAEASGRGGKLPPRRGRGVAVFRRCPMSV